MAIETINGEQWEITDKVKRLVRPAAGSEPLPLNQVDFIKLCQEAGGMTDDMLVACESDNRIKAFWIKFDRAPVLHKTDPRTQAGIAALAALGYLPNGAAAMNSGWPVA